MRVRDVGFHGGYTVRSCDPSLAVEQRVRLDVVLARVEVQIAACLVVAPPPAPPRAAACRRRCCVAGPSPRCSRGRRCRPAGRGACHRPAGPSPGLRGTSCAPRPSRPPARVPRPRRRSSPRPCTRPRSGQGAGGRAPTETTSGAPHRGRNRSDGPSPSLCRSSLPPCAGVSRVVGCDAWSVAPSGVSGKGRLPVLHLAGQRAGERAVAIAADA